jgi:glycosyltransferase involved in cell wall biosynthesis
MLVSIVVATFNRMESLVRCVRSLQAQKMRPADVELVVVDDGSRDGTRHWLQQQADLQTVLMPHGGAAAARNAGVRCSRGEIVAFTDDDCTAAPGWLESLVCALREHDVAGGQVINAVPTNLLAESAQAIIDRIGEEVNGDMRNGGMLTANNVAYRRANFEAAGGFDERYTVGGEERDLNYRLWLQKARLTFAPHAVVQHHANPTLGRFLCQQFIYGRGARRFYRQVPRPAPLPLSFYRHLFRSFGQGRPAAHRTAMATALLASQCAVICGYMAPSSGT